MENHDELSPDNLSADSKREPNEDDFNAIAPDIDKPNEDDFDDIAPDIDDELYKKIERELDELLDGDDEMRHWRRTRRGKDDDDARLQRNAYTWTAEGQYSHYIISFVIQRFIKQAQEDMIVLRRESSAEFVFGYQQKTSIIVNGTIVFVYRGRAFVYTVSTEMDALSNTITGNGDIDELVERINYEIKWNNPLRNKHIQLVPSGRSEYECLFKKPPVISFDDLICDPEMKADIFDQTILHFEHIEGNNGIILHGRPGTGKSLCCQAIIAEALKRGYSTCFLTTRVDYSLLNEFLTKFLAPCIVVLEDIDSFGESRRHVLNSSLANFLQFLSGLYENDDKIVFIATTNYIEHLDDAIADRPVRFNRKYKFELPSPREIDQLIDLYFKDEGITAAQKAKCYNKGFTGSHVKELQRTARLLAFKHETSVAQVFDKAVEVVSRNFSTGERKAGFRYDDE